jgi:hypothetical protein
MRVSVFGVLDGVAFASGELFLSPSFSSLSSIYAVSNLTVCHEKDSWGTYTS